jgi:hypothetical protein
MRRRPPAGSPATLGLLLHLAPLGGMASAGTPTATALPSGITTVFVILFENHDWATIKGEDSAPYLNGLLTRADAAYASNYHNVPPEATLHPSEPNYVWLEGGTNVYPDTTFTRDDPPSGTNSTRSPEHLVALMAQQGIPWKAYQEDISGTDCPIARVGHYVPRHNPFLFFHDVSGDPPSADTASCQQHIRPYRELAGDLANDTVHGYAFLTPNLCHDMHPNLCWGGWNPVKQGDNWLAANLPPILASAVYLRGEALVVMTWDEGSDDDTNHPLGMILLSPKTKGHGYTNTLLYTHSSLVKTLEALFGLSPLVGHAADAATQDFSDLFA